MSPAGPAEESSRISAVESPSTKQKPVEDQEEILAVPEQGDPTQQQEDPAQQQEDPAQQQEDPAQQQEDPTQQQEDPAQQQEVQAMTGGKTTALDPETQLAVLEQEISPASQEISPASQESAEEQSELFQGPEQNITGSRPLRIAEQLTSSPDLISMNVPDRIEPLQTDAVSPKVKSYAVAQLAEMDRQTLIRDFADEHNISLMSVANAGIKGINKLTGSEISLLASRDEEGEVSGFQFKSKRLSIRSPIGREE